MWWGVLLLVCGRCDGEKLRPGVGVRGDVAKREKGCCCVRNAMVLLYERNVVA